MYVFAVTTGYSGTKYLAGLFEGCEATAVVHEHVMASKNGSADSAPPTGIVLDFYLTGFCDEIGKWFTGPHLGLVRGAMRERGADHYVETNNLLCKAGLPFLIAALGEEEVRLIHLRRSAYQTARSFLNLNKIPGKLYGQGTLSSTGLPSPFTPWPWGPTVCLPWREDVRDVSPFVACLWLWLETEALALRYAELYPLHTVELETLDGRTFPGVAEWCGLRWRGSEDSLVEDRNSKKDRWKGDSAPVFSTLREQVNCVRALLPATRVRLFDEIVEHSADGLWRVDNSEDNR